MFDSRLWISSLRTPSRLFQFRAQVSYIRHATHIPELSPHTQETNKMAEIATAMPSVPVANNTPATGGTGTGQGSGTGTGDGTFQVQQQSQSQNQSQTQANNTNPTTTGTTNNENQPPDQRANRGLPYYEKLRRELRDTLQKKRLMDKSMAQLEDQIYRFEQSYLEETTAGNIIKGFDTYIKGSSTGSGLGASGMSLSASGVGTASRRKAAVTDNDRVFSRSSASFMRDSPAPSSTQTTPSHVQTPNSTYNGSTGKPGANANGSGETSSAAGSVKGSSAGASSKSNKKKAASLTKGEDDEDEKPPGKRFKISYAGRE
ncbi:chromatin modification-related protein EAF6/MEAF6 [Aspergillus undulatus]|uniref:chromatin modification-related protein EAF6/MEAF6 n=1 Tax=Aspergillus undulatus TaxID=1810928 RepID=UPI003CCD2A5A